MVMVDLAVGVVRYRVKEENREPSEDWKIAQVITRRVDASQNLLSYLLCWRQNYARPSDHTFVRNESFLHMITGYDRSTYYLLPYRFTFPRSVLRPLRGVKQHHHHQLAASWSGDRCN